MLQRTLTLCLILLVGCCTSSMAQRLPSTLDTNALYIQAQQMTNALLKKDYKVFVSYTYPRVKEMVGGDEKMIDMLKAGFGEGFTLRSLELGKISKAVVAGSEIHVLLPEHLLVDLDSGMLAMDGCLLAISADGGKRWSFIDVAGLNQESLKSVLPNYNAELVLPEKHQPVFTKKKK